MRRTGADGGGLEPLEGEVGSGVNIAAKGEERKKNMELYDVSQ